MSKYAGTQTEKNLQAAFAGKSQARDKYTYFASKAKKEGFEQTAALFLKTAGNEKERAKRSAVVPCSATQRPRRSSRRVRSRSGSAGTEGIPW